MAIDWKNYWSSRPQCSTGSIHEILSQVGKTRFGKPVPQEQICILVRHISDTLNLGSGLAAIDLGCGNGLLTHALAERVNRVIGFDYSEALLETARTYFNRNNISYRIGDLTQMDMRALPDGTINVAWSVEVIQNLNPNNLPNLLDWLKVVLVPGGRFHASGIPDISRIRNFYNTADRWQMHLNNAKDGKEQMGHWWSKEELIGVANQAGLNINFVALPEDFYTSNYRFDAVFSKAVS